MIAPVERNTLERPDPDMYKQISLKSVPLARRNMLKSSLARTGEAIFIDDDSEKVEFDERQIKRSGLVRDIMAHIALRAPNKHGSGHPGGSLSGTQIADEINRNIDYDKDWPLLISAAHYSVLAHVSQWLYARVEDDPRYKDLKEIIERFRAPGGLPGHAEVGDGDTPFGTGPLGKGPSNILGAAIGYKMRKEKGLFNVLVGDGEMQEGQVFEMMRVAAQKKADNVIMHCDFNDVQIHDRPTNTMSSDIADMAHSIGWHVIEVENGNDPVQVATAQAKARDLMGKGKPVFVCYYTVMGHGVKTMEEDSNKVPHVSHHGAPVKGDQYDEAIAALPDLDDLIAEYEEFRLEEKKRYAESSPVQTNTPLEWDMEKLKKNKYKRTVKEEDGAARQDFGKTHVCNIMKADPRIVVLHADIAGSGGFGEVQKVFGELGEDFEGRIINCGVAEANMYMMAAGLRQAGFIPVTYTFAPFGMNEGGANIRLIDINLKHAHCGVVHDLTHAGTSVGEDGPTHQELNFMNVPYFNSEVWIPADSNQAAAAAEKSLEIVANGKKQIFTCYPRTGHPQLKKEDGSIFYDEDYEFNGKADVIRGLDNIEDDMTVIAADIPVHEAVAAADRIKKETGKSIRVLNIACIRPIDASAVLKAACETGNLVVIEDHNIEGGLATQVSDLVATYGLPTKVRRIGVSEYMESAPAGYLMKEVGFDSENIEQVIMEELESGDGRTEYGLHQILDNLHKIQTNTKNRFAEAAVPFVEEVREESYFSVLSNEWKKYHEMSAVEKLQTRFRRFAKAAMQKLPGQSA
ncbi:hypothetical protein KJ652_01305 [Patescibacteria group bacterium]|nr:hypothetical protein [Patescibacteria group bacterium]MBU1910796.1 hypothetical protein [Patescibacteria group bacterium]